MTKVFFGMLLALGLVTVAALATEKMHPREAAHVEPSQITWVQPYGPQGPSFGFVQGSFGKLGAPASMFIKVAAGFDSGWHDHDGDYQGVVLKGTFTEQQTGAANETFLATGTYFTQPGKIAHRNGCTRDSECFLFVHFPNGATSHPTTADGKRLPPPPQKKAER